MRAQLLPVDGGPPIEIVKDLVVVGRKDDCDIRLEHKSVSKLHCVLVKMEGLLLLRDLGSTNGTLVNGKRLLDEMVLRDGDTLQLGSLVLQVVLHDEPGEPLLPGLSEVPSVTDTALFGQDETWMTPPDPPQNP